MGVGGGASSSSASIVSPVPSSTSPLGALSGNHKKISGGAIAGIIIAVVVVVALVAAFVFVFLRRRRIRRRRVMERMAQAYDFAPSQGTGGRDPGPTSEDTRAPESRKERFAQQIRYFGSVHRAHGGRTRSSPRKPRTSVARDEKRKEAGETGSRKKKVGYTIEKKPIVDEEKEVASLSKVVDDLRRAALPSDYGGSS